MRSLLQRFGTSSSAHCPAKAYVHSDACSSWQLSDKPRSLGLGAQAMIKNPFGCFHKWAARTTHKPEVVGLLLQGHPQKGPPICRNIQIVLIRISSELRSTPNPSKRSPKALLKDPQSVETAIYLNLYPYLHLYLYRYLYPLYWSPKPLSKHPQL